MSADGSLPASIPVPATGLGWCVLVLFGFFTCSGLWSVVQIFTQWLLSRAPDPKGKAEIARQYATIEKDKEDVETNRQKALAESQVALQQAALDADAKTIARLNGELNECLARCEKRKGDFDGLRDAMTAIVDLFTGLLARMRAAADVGSDVIVMKISAEEFMSWRAAINSARERLL